MIPVLLKEEIDAEYSISVLQQSDDLFLDAVRTACCDSRKIEDIDKGYFDCEEKIKLRCEECIFYSHNNFLAGMLQHIEEET